MIKENNEIMGINLTGELKKFHFSLLILFFIYSDVPLTTKIISF